MYRRDRFTHVQIDVEKLLEFVDAAVSSRGEDLQEASYHLRRALTHCETESLRSEIAYQLERVERALTKVHQREVVAEIVEGNNRDLKEALCCLNRGEFSVARTCLARIEERLQKVADCGNAHEAFNTARTSWSDYVVETDQAACAVQERITKAELQAGARHAQEAKSLFSRFDANIRTKNVGAARSILSQIHSSKEVRCGLIVNLGSSEAVDQRIGEAIRRLSRLEEEVKGEVTKRSALPRRAVHT